MQISAEIRWFWQGECPDGLDAWFKDSKEGDKPRRDEYLRDPSQQQLGIKRRGEKPGYEVKGLVKAEFGPVTVGGAPFQTELWSKWTTEKLVIAAELLIAIDKRRRLRKFSADGPNLTEVPLNDKEEPLTGFARPNCGCNVELTCVMAESQCWWTLGFESFGGIDEVGDILASTVALLEKRGPMISRSGFVGSYPAWLCRHFASRT